jgi:hypothetical protein
MEGRTDPIKGGIMGRRAIKSAPLWVAAALWLAFTACSNPIQDYISTRDSNRRTATATMWTPTSTNTNTPRPMRTRTATSTQTFTATVTPSPTPTDTPFPTDTPQEGSETAPPGMRIPSITATFSSNQDRYIETAGLTKFSYVPPIGWKKVPGSGSTLTSWKGPEQKADTNCMLLFMVLPSDKTASEFAKSMLDSLTSTEGNKVVSQAKFVNNAGLDAYKVVMTVSSQEENGQIVMYFFQKRGYIIMGVYGRLVGLNPEQDAIVDASLKTLRYE